MARWTAAALLGAWAAGGTLWAGGPAEARRVILTSDLGWAAGQDVSAELAGLLESGALTSGDELILEETFRVRGSFVLPDDFTLSAAAGAGFEVFGIAPRERTSFLVLGNRDTLRNLTVEFTGTPELGGRGSSGGIDFFGLVGVFAHRKAGVTVEDCRFRGMISHHFKIKECSDVRFTGCHLTGGFWTIFCSGQDYEFQRCLIEESCGDAIKGIGDRVLISDCVFQDNGRDGLDTTGGFSNAVVRDCTFRRMGVSGIDIKSFCGPGEGGAPRNAGILVERCRFLDLPNAVVVTTIDASMQRGGAAFLNASNMKEYAPHDILLDGCLVGHVERPLRRSEDGGYGVNTFDLTGEYMRIVLLKDGYGVRFRNTRVLGHRIRPVAIRQMGGRGELGRGAAAAIERTVSGSIRGGPEVIIRPGETRVPFACGPRPRS